MTEGIETSGPDTWATAALADVAFVLMGQSPPSSTYNACGEGLPFFQGKAEFGSLYPEPRIWCSSPKRIAAAGDLLLSVRAPVGPTNLALATCGIGRGLAAIRPAEGLDLRYLLYAIRRFAADLDAQGTGTTFKAVSGDIVRQFEIPIAPSAEQPRIADALDELFSDLDAGVATLERIRNKLKLYRASVLKAAVDGTLTSEWRAEHPHTEPACKLLERILVERRRQWESKQLAKFDGKGHEAAKNWKAKYSTPAGPESSNLPRLPEGWSWATVDQVAAFIQYGSSAKANGDARGIAMLRMGNVTPDGKLLIDKLKFLPVDHGEFPALILEKGDLLFNRTNSSELVGKTAVYSGTPTPCSFASYLIRIRVLPGVSPEILMYSLNSTLGRAWIKDVVTQTVGQANVNGTKLAAFRFPLPPHAEQEAIVELVEDQLSVIDHLEADIDAKLKSAHSLRQAILHHAFTGKLVPQDPRDEPASELLKRIAADRESQNNGARHGLPPRKARPARLRRSK